jgi:hypothetical protein
MVTPIPAMTPTGIAAWSRHGSAATASRSDDRRSDRSRRGGTTIRRGLPAATALGGVTGPDAIQKTDAVSMVTGVTTRSRGRSAEATGRGRRRPWWRGDVPAQGG